MTSQEAYERSLLFIQHRRHVTVTHICPVATTPTTVVLDIASHFEAFKQDLSDLEHEHVGTQSPALTNEQLFALFKALVDDHINTRLRWARDTDSFIDTALALIPWLDPVSGVDGLNTNRLDAFLTDIVDDIEVGISECLDNTIGHNTWMVWTTRRLGYDIAIQRGEDYRILDWERRNRRGEFKNAP